MAREISAGGVVLRLIEGRWWLATIEPHPSAEKPAPKKPIAALPKGLVDPGERPEQTALREVREETGLEATLVAKLTDIRYVYVRSWGDGERVFKIVSFYLLLYHSGELGDIAPDMRIEVRSAEWIPLEDAPNRLTYRGERDVACLAVKYIAAHPELANDNDRSGADHAAPANPKQKPSARRELQPRAPALPSAKESA
jgi:8-oxo-dGTP pyrophosphatase MutT (NUDIX family)